jgi:hypothetical protein
MTNEAKPQKNSAKNRQFNAALAQMPESYLNRLLQSVEALQEDLQLVPLPDGESVEGETDAHNFLKIWNAKITRLLALKQAKDAYDQLHNWDNEGGTVHHTAPRRLLSRMVDGERRLVWADAEEDISK